MPGKGKPFKKGRSGNPSGRPKRDAELQELAREFTQEAVEELAAILKGVNTPPAAKVAAAKELLDRGWGRAPQTQNINLNAKRSLLDWTTDELLDLAASYRDERTGAKKAGNGKPDPLH